LLTRLNGKQIDIDGDVVSEPYSRDVRDGKISGIDITLK